MNIIRGIHTWRTRPTPVVFAMGMFDGVHRGHQTVIAAARDIARAVHGVCYVLTFDMHPKTLLYPNETFGFLSTYEERLHLLKQTGVDGVLLLYFSQYMAAMTPDVFFRDVLMKRIHAAAIVVGENFRFGAQRHGDIELLRSLGHKYTCPIHVVPSYTYRKQTLSSTFIRSLIAHGKVADAARCLGRYYTITGTVVHGAAIGRRHGVPTMNVHIHRGKIVPHGVFAGYVELGKQRYAAAINIGTRPTFSQDDIMHCEAHIMDASFHRTTYGRNATVSLVHAIRDERAFDNVDALFAQIGRDIRQVKKKLKVAVMAQCGTPQSPLEYKGGCSERALP